MRIAKWHSRSIIPRQHRRRRLDFHTIRETCAFTRIWAIFLFIFQREPIPLFIYTFLMSIRTINMCITGKCRKNVKLVRTKITDT